MIEYFHNRERYTYGVCGKCLSIFYNGMGEEFHHNGCLICGNPELLIERQAPPSCVREDGLITFRDTSVREIPKDSDEYNWLVTNIITENDIQYYIPLCGCD